MISIVNGPAYRALPLAEWKAQAGAGWAPDDVLLRKVGGDAPVVTEDRTLRFRISSGSVDRDNDSIAPAGWRLDAWMANPVVLWAHDYSALPIGKGTGAFARADGLFADAVFPDEQLYPFGHQVYRLLREGFLKATSVGFRPLKWTRNEERGGVDFLEQELLEFSVVPVPANPEALMEAKAKGCDAAQVRRWLNGGGKAGDALIQVARSGTGFLVDDEVIIRGVRKAVEEQLPAALREAVVPAVRRAVMMVTGKVD